MLAISVFLLQPVIGCTRHMLKLAISSTPAKGPRALRKGWLRLREHRGALAHRRALDQRVRLYDVEKDWELRKDVRARGIRWTITDTCLSPDQRFLLYSSISPTVHLLALGASWDVVESLANVTEVCLWLQNAPWFGPLT
eukprot:1155681-Pelagomonas_calceolata.AAC.5